MTVKNNSLSDKLNGFKNKNQKLFEDELNRIPQKNSLIDIFNSIATFFIFLFKSLIFGYSIKIIFNTLWQFWSIACIGLSISFILIYIDQVIHNTK